MKRFTLLLLPIAVLALSCATSSRDAASVGQPFCCATNTVSDSGTTRPSFAALNSQLKVPSTSPFTDKSLYQLESTWTNDGGQALKLGQLQGRVQVVAMFFASCTYACPVIVHDMKRIEAALPETVRANTGFTLITIDTERDTPDALRAYRTANKLPANRWTLLHGTPDDTLELAALLGVKFKREASGQFAHSNLITILNAKGEIIDQLVGLNQDIQDTVKRVAGAARDASQP